VVVEEAGAFLDKEGAIGHGAEVSRQAMLGQASSAIRAALGAVIPPFPNS